MPSDLTFKAMNLMHRVMLLTSFGLLGRKVLGMPVIELTTTGRRSGQARPVMLTVPVRDGDNLVLVASRGGDDHHPAWFLNLKANPEVQVAETGGPRRPMRARIADADERAELWPRVTAANSVYAGYQNKTDREIPLVILEPAP
jgi:deazaflavin-dependent oxidoreductase (nitroreductase family)